MKTGRGGTYLSLCNSPDVCQRHRTRRRGEREGGRSASADYLSTSVINVETRILPGPVFMCVSGCVSVKRRDTDQ